MPFFATIEDAPHHLKLLDDYGKTSVTLSIALLSLSTAFVDKLLKPPVGWIPVLLVILLWLCLLAILILGLSIGAHLTGVSANYARARQLAYPDALMTISTGTQVKIQDPNEVIQITDPNKRSEITQALEKSKWRTDSAYSCAHFSFVFVAMSALLIIGLGLHQSIQLTRTVDASSAAEKSVDFVTGQYHLAANGAGFRSLSYDEKNNANTVEIVDKQAPTTKYDVTISGSSGDVTKVTRSP